MSLISSTTPLIAGDTFTSAVFPLTRATQITGSVFSDHSGTLNIDQSGDGTNFDVDDSISVSAGLGAKVEIDVINQYFRVRYVNGGTNQNIFRLYIDIRDPYGDFLVAQSGPSVGGAWVVLFKDLIRGYQFVGRYDGIDGWNANGNAAIDQNKSGQYASFLVSDATVTEETLQTTTQHAPLSF